MKKLIINLGQEAIVGVLYEIAGKSKSLRRVLEIPSFDCYNNYGRFDMTKVAANVKRLLPRDARSLDTEIILPGYATSTHYINAVDGSYEKDSKRDKKRPDEKVVFIGENQTKRINQVIEYSNKDISAIVSAFHREKINVVRAISATTAYHNFMSLFNYSETYGGFESKAHIGIEWGIAGTNYIIMLGNLPVESRLSDHSLYQLYDDVVKMGCELPLQHVLKVLNNFELSSDPDTGIMLETRTNMITDGHRTLEVSENVIGLIKDAFFDYLTNMIQEIRNLYDYTRERYSVPSVYICTNSKLLDECLCKTYNDAFPIEYIATTGKIEIYNERFVLKSIEEINDKYVPVIGCAIEGIKKGIDFYDN